MTVMEYDILNAVEKIDEACLDAEARVLDAMFEEYTKIFQLTEFCDDQTVLEQFDIFAEAEDKKDDGDELTEGGFWKKKDNTFLKKVVAFIARLVQWIGRKISGSKSSDDNMKKVIDKAEEVSKSAELTPKEQETIDKAISENEAGEGETPEETNGGNIFTKNKGALIAILGVLGFAAAGTGIYVAKKKKGSEPGTDQDVIEDKQGDQKRIGTSAQNPTDADKGNGAPTETSAQGQEVSVNVNKFNGYILLDPGKTKPFATPVDLGKMRGILELLHTWSTDQRNKLNDLSKAINAAKPVKKQVTAKEYIVTFTDDMFKKMNKFTTRVNTTEKDVVDALKNKTFFFNRVRRWDAGGFWQMLYMISSHINETQTELGRVHKLLETISNADNISDGLKELCENISGKAKLFQDFANIFTDVRDKMYDDTQLQINVFNAKVDNKGRKFNAALGKYAEKGHENDLPKLGKKTLSKDASSFVGNWVDGKTAEINAKAVQRQKQGEQPNS